MDIEAAANDFFEYSAHYKQKIQSKTERLKHSHIKRLERDLLESKQNVVKNIRRYRELEKNIVHNLLANEALQTRMNSASSLTAHRYEDYRRMLGATNSGGFSRFPLSDASLRSIEAVSGLASRYPGLGRVIYESAVRYNDDGLAARLESVPLSTASVSFALFARMAEAASKQKISRGDALAMFHRAHELAQAQLQRLSPPAVDTDQRLIQLQWENMKRLLRKEIFHLHLILTVHSSAEYASHSHSSAASTAGFLLSSAERSKGIGGRKAAAAAAVDAPESLPSPGKLRPRDLPLSQSLQRSKEKQSSFQQRIADSISSLYDNEVVPIEQLRGHRKALHLFRNLGAKKMHSVLRAALHRFLRAQLHRWRQAAESLRIRASNGIFLQELAAYRLLRLVEVRGMCSCAAAVSQLKRHALVSRYKEQTRHSVQLQRYWRGSLTRMRITRERQRLAAINLQAMARMVIARTKTQRMRHFARRIAAARRIQCMVKKRCWNRVLRRMLRKLFVNQMAVRIQKHVRGR